MSENKREYIPTIFEKSNNCPLTHEKFPRDYLDDSKLTDLIPQDYLEPEHGYACDNELILPEISENELVRHYIKLSQRNYGIDTGIYPLGSCTMKYNPKLNEEMANLEGFRDIHPYQPEIQGALELMYKLEQYLCDLTGMKNFTLQPAAGAHGEYTGIAIIKKYFSERDEKKKFIVIPDSAHGTNPATSAMCGYGVITINSTEEGEVSLKELEIAMEQGDVAAIMLTNPNTLGLFDRHILEITEIVHKNGGLCYYDGANMNAMMGKCRPGEMGFDVVHLNLHKTFSTPHGGGGPGSGPVGVKDFLEKYLPNPRIIQKNGVYDFDYSNTHSIGKIKSFFGNFGILVRAYTYISIMGKDGLKRASENAVLNANYLRVNLSKIFNLPINRICQHEFVLNDKGLPFDITTTDIAKRLLDYNIHAPTIYFPLIIHGAMMFEPTETESKRSLDEYIKTMKKIREECNGELDKLRKAPLHTPVGRLDDVQAARNPILKYEKN